MYTASFGAQAKAETALAASAEMAGIVKAVAQQPKADDGTDQEQAREQEPSDEQ